MATGKAHPLNCREHGIESITHIHDESYIANLREICKRGAGYLDADTYVSSGSFEAALAMADAALSGVDEVFGGRNRRVFVLGRPPGHHAERDHAMGFCLINNVAVAAQYAIDHYGAKRVAIVDFDVHHGNGTQHAFYDRQDVFFVSSHRYPFYPGTGGADETGVRDGKGYTINLPLSAGSGDEALLNGFESSVIPALERYRPDMVLVSAGFDAAVGDPLGGMTVTGEGFLHIGKLIRKLADRTCGGRIVSVLEGGYDNRGNRESIMSYLDGIGFD